MASGHFASALVLEFAIEEIKSIDPSLIPDDWVRSRRFERAQVPAISKAQLLAYVTNKVGLDTIKEVGRRISHNKHLPLAPVLLRSADAKVLAQKWMRMERYYHSTNRMEIEAEPFRWYLRRYAKDGSMPSDPETALILGILIGALEEFGCQGVTLLDEEAAKGEGRYVLAWTGVNQKTHSDEQDPIVERHASQKVIGVLERDISRVWSLEETATELRTSKRSLQRRLKDEGVAFTGLVRASRVKAACKVLSADDASLADTGYYCGYADQSHFQRDFKRMMGMTPDEFRRLGR